MISWAKELYIGKHARDRAAEIMQKCNDSTRVHRAYLITFAANGKDELDLIPAAQVKELCAHGNLPTVVGLAASKKEAMHLVEQIAKECFLARGDLKLRSFLTEREGRA